MVLAAPTGFPTASPRLQSVLSFPPNPVIGQVYFLWAWDGVKWICGTEVSMPITGPIIGITNGVAANPGEVGEWLAGTMNINIALNAAQQTVPAASVLTLTPGDWNLQAYLEPTGLFDAVILDGSVTAGSGTPPPGFSDAPQAFSGAFNNPGITFNTMLVTQTVRVLNSAAVAVSFNVIVYNSPAAQTATVTVTARRMR